MESQKVENLLNLALFATPEERAQSGQLRVGYDAASQTFEVLIRYQGPWTAPDGNTQNFWAIMPSSGFRKVMWTL